MRCDDLFDLRNQRIDVDTGSLGDLAQVHLAHNHLCNRVVERRELVAVLDQLILKNGYCLKSSASFVRLVISIIFSLPRQPAAS